MFAWLCSIVMVATVLFGGGTHAGFFGDVAIQLLAIPLLALSLWRAFEPDRSERSKRLLILGGCAGFSLFALQLTPLPFGLPFMADAISAGAHELGLAPVDTTWAPRSVSPQATWAAAASLIAPAAVFVAAIQLNLAQRLNIVWALLALGGLSLVLGFLQAAQGAATGLRFYAVTNPTEAVGFFANRNHFAAYLVVTLVLGAIWYASAARKALREGALNTTAVLSLAAAGAFIISVVAGLAMARSRAGVFLAMAALVGILLMMLRQRSARVESHRAGHFSVGRLSVVTILFAALFAAQFGLGSILSRFKGDALEDLRVPLAWTTAEAAVRSLPFGAGLGSFVPVYAAVEKDTDVAIGFANRAHNDLAEIALETGVFSILLLLAFFVWFLPRAYGVWRRPPHADHTQTTLQRAASLIILLLLAHSLVDYPLRTAALSSVFVFFCAVLATEAPVEKQEREQPKRRAFEQRRACEAAPGEKWDADLHWPQDWQRRGD
jgi:O-antigen ligase